MARTDRQDEYLGKEEPDLAFFLCPNTPAGGINW